MGIYALPALDKGLNKYGLSGRDMSWNSRAAQTRRERDWSGDGRVAELPDRSRFGTVSDLERVTSPLLLPQEIGRKRRASSAAIGRIKRNDDCEESETQTLDKLCVEGITEGRTPFLQRAQYPGQKSHGII